MVNELERWPIDRTWMVAKVDARLQSVSTDEVREYRACGFLGPAGIGKTYELRQFAERDRQGGRDVRFERLAELGQTADGLVAQLRKLTSGTSSESVIYLDALDEVMIPVKTAGLVVERWIRDELAINRPTFRISCRSAAWPPGVFNALEEIYGDEVCATVFLQPLCDDDVVKIVLTSGVDAESFVTTVNDTGVFTLAQQPLTLQMLLHIYSDQGALPSRRSELFSQGVEKLASERIERLEGGTSGNYPVSELLEAAERLACLAILSGKETIDLGDSPPPSALGRLRLENLPGEPRLGHELVLAVGRCGLCDSDQPRRFRFGHRQIAEYLAGRRLARLLFHQSRALLSSGLGWREGVAGPLSETAAFAAMHSDEIAAWVAEYDPEVIGLSDVADGSLRRKAALRFLEKFRRHELTNAQIVRRGGSGFSGYRYAGAEEDLKPVLKERNTGCEDVLECAIAMVGAWQLSSLSNELADLMLDSTAPLEARIAAGYVLADLGIVEARRRLKPLTDNDCEDPQFDLKGLALRCNWPEGLTVPDLLKSIETPVISNYGGAYSGFLGELDRSGFDADGHRLAGLKWARKFMHQDSDIDPQGRIARRIAIAAVNELGEQNVVDALADVVLSAAENFAGSPFTIPPRFMEEETNTESAKFDEMPSERLKLIDAVVAKITDDSQLWRVARETTEMVLAIDFPWLLERATDVNRPMPMREKYAELARSLPWKNTAESVAALRSVHAVEPVASKFPFSLEIDSDKANMEGKAFEELQRQKKWRSPAKLDPPPKDRVEHALVLSETNDARYFLNVSRELTLKENSTRYRFSRFLTTTPGWADAEEGTRNRIVESAKRFLADETEEPECCQTVPFNRILHGHMAAFWLVLERERSWLEAQPIEWWQRWCLYILRQLHLTLSDEHEQEEKKLALFTILYQRAAANVREAVKELALSDQRDARQLLRSLLPALHHIDDEELDVWLSEQLVAGTIDEDLIGDVATFLLSHNRSENLSACFTLLEPEAVAKAEEASVAAAIALLLGPSATSWKVVCDFLERRPDLAPRILGEFAHRENYGDSQYDGTGLNGLVFKQVGELVVLLLVSFPPESDPNHAGAHSVGPDDSARMLRDRLISWLGDQSDAAALEALRDLERHFGAKYPWIRRPRAGAEQAYRRSRWVPVAPRSVAELLSAESKRLIRSGQDIVDGIVAAIEQYEHQLHHGNPNDVEDFWNRPRRGKPTPKEEERVSDKLCDRIRDYFRNYAVTADREVQIFRRKLSDEVGGAPGSELDVICRVPPVGVANGTDPISVPIEVKLSHNREARTGLRDQLVDRYMSELGATAHARPFASNACSLMADAFGWGLEKERPPLAGM